MKETKETAQDVAQKTSWMARYKLDIGIILVTCILLFIGANWQLFTRNEQFLNPTSDVAKYQCYAEAFLHGTARVRTVFTFQQCGFLDSKPVTNAQIAQFMSRHGFPQPLVQFVQSQPADSALHAIPHEYPYLTLVFFSLALIVPALWYQFAFAFWMLVLFAVIYCVLRRFHSRGAAVAFAIFMVTGASVTGIARFDLVPAAATLFAIVCASYKRWNWAYVFLAVATLLKFYPGVLLVPFLIAQQMELGRQVHVLAWKRWSALVLFAVLCIVVMGVSLLLSVEGTIGQFTYFGQRPMQVEAWGASLMWIVTSITHSPMSYGKTFGSLNILSHPSLMSKVSILLDVMLLVGLLYTWWLQVRGKANLAASCLLTLLIIIVTGKVFSPQYLIWVAPLIAYVGGRDRRWIISWSIIGILTSIIYPVIYNQRPLNQVPFIPAFFPLVTLRDFVLLGFVLVIIVAYSRHSRTAPAAERAEEKRINSASLAHEING